MNTSKYLILGGGMVAGYAAKQLVESGLRPGELHIVSADSSIPYERPPISKGFLAGKDPEAGIFISADAFYRSHGIQVQLNCIADSVDPDRKTIHLRSGAEIGFEKLIVATGTQVRKLSIPGAGLDGVYHTEPIR
jgi:3-phenylpropionate/trans-cinnamate dioxygenase ferredoxin reductase subunit